MPEQLKTAHQRLHDGLPDPEDFEFGRSWKTHERHNQGGRPGIEHRELHPGVHVLLYFSRTGRLVGALWFYEHSFRVQTQSGRVVEAPAGEVVLRVAPNRQRRGIGTQLLSVANAKWRIDWGAQRYSPAGRACVAKFLADAPAEAA